MRPQSLRLVIGWFTLSSLVAGCGPSAGSQAGTGAAQNAGRVTPKVLTIGSLREPYSIEGFVSGTVRDLADTAGDLAQNHLTVRDFADEDRPQLATELPSVAGGTWKVNADGTMDVTWKIRSGVKWHDGAPFTSDDLLFSLMIHKDKELPYSSRPDVSLIESATAPDPLTLLVHWAQISVVPLQANGLEPMRRDLFEDLYRTDKQAFVASPKWKGEFVGLGPYKMVNWDPGSDMQLARFDDYWQGRPPLDTVDIKFIKDANTLVANALAGSIDLIVPPSIDVDAAQELQRRWAGTGNQVHLDPTPRFGYVEVQLRPDVVKPAALLKPEIRRALYQAIDRPSISDVVAAGLPPADSWYAPNDPARTAMEPFIPKYAFDPAAARQQLAQQGYTAGADGTLRLSGGDTLALESWIMVQGSDKAAAIVADNWKQVGVDTAVSPIPPAHAGDRQYRVSYPGVLVNSTAVLELINRLNSQDIAGPANNWGGRNVMGYSNPAVDSALAGLNTSIDEKDRLPYFQEIVKTVMGEVGIMPLYWEPRPVVMAKGVKADIKANRPGWNAFTWDKEA